MNLNWDLILGTWIGALIGAALTLYIVNKLLTKRMNEMGFRKFKRRMVPMTEAEIDRKGHELWQIGQATAKLRDAIVQARAALRTAYGDIAEDLQKPERKAVIERKLKLLDEALETLSKSIGR